MSDDAPEDKINHGELLGAWTRRCRLSLGLTQEQVAERMGPDTPDNFVTKLENGTWKNLLSRWRHRRHPRRKLYVVGGMDAADAPQRVPKLAPRRRDRRPAKIRPEIAPPNPLDKRVV